MAVLYKDAGFVIAQTIVSAAALEGMSVSTYIDSLDSPYGIANREMVKYTPAELRDEKRRRRLMFLAVLHKHIPSVRA